MSCATLLAAFYLGRMLNAMLGRIRVANVVDYVTGVVFPRTFLQQSLHRRRITLPFHDTVSVALPKIDRTREKNDVTMMT